jgi:arginase family enzyme
MKKPHFFKARSRIGLTNKPIRQEEWNFGVEDGPDVILSEEFLSKIPEKEVSEITFTNPEDIDPKDYVKVLSEELSVFKNRINKSFQDGEIQIVVGGENTVTFSSLLALIERVKYVSQIGYIQFDSHGEMNSFHGSDSHNFHGMYMRPFFDTFDIPQIEELIPNKLKKDQAFIVGDQVLDGDEPEFYEKNDLHSITFQEYLANKEEIQNKLKEFLAKFKYIHVNFDVDVFERSVAGATGIPEDGKWGKDEVFEILSIISCHEGVSLDVSEINPKKAGVDRTIRVIQDVIIEFVKA